jgi:hypothetical protein
VLNVLHHFCNRLTRAVKAGQKSTVLYRHHEPNEPTKERPLPYAKILEQKIQYLDLDDEIKCLLPIFEAFMGSKRNTSFRIPTETFNFYQTFQKRENPYADKGFFGALQRRNFLSFEEGKVFLFLQG